MRSRQRAYNILRKHYVPPEPAAPADPATPDEWRALVEAAPVPLRRRPKRRTEPLTRLEDLEDQTKPDPDRRVGRGAPWIERWGANGCVAMTEMEFERGRGHDRGQVTQRTGAYSADGAGP